MIEGHHIICFGFAEWDNPYRTNQHHIMERLSRNNKVLFIESQGLRRPTAQKKDIIRIVKRLFKWLQGTRVIHENLLVFAPLVIPFHKYAVVRKFNRWFLAYQLDGIVARYGFSHPLLWSYVPTAVEYLGRWKEKVSVYHCVDELSANPLIPAKTVQDMEERFLKKVDVVFTTAPALYESKKKLNANTRYFPNVADFAHFNKACSPDIPLAKRLRAINSPRLGFIGALSGYKLDFALLASLAQKHPEWALVLIGPKGEGEKAADVSILEKEKNIHLLGGVPAEQLPSYLKGFDVCLLPNILNEYTKNMFPMKFFEYLAAGKPVVSTWLDSLQEFGEYCSLAKNHAEFEASLVKALAEDTLEKQKQRVELAKRYTWETRLDEFSEVITDTIKRKTSHAS